MSPMLGKIGATSDVDRIKEGKQRAEESEFECLLSLRLCNEEEIRQDSNCDATWEIIPSLSPTLTYSTIVDRMDCIRILEKTVTDYTLEYRQIGRNENIFRTCTENGTWLCGNWTDCMDCVNNYDESVKKMTGAEYGGADTVSMILFIGSIVSIHFIFAAVSIHYNFRRQWSDKVTVRVNFMVALLIRSVLFIVTTEPVIFNHAFHYKKAETICKIIICATLFATVASINWILLQGVYLHSRLTNMVAIDEGTRFRWYYLIGWIVPFSLTAIYAIIMEVSDQLPCWDNYGERHEPWIMLSPSMLSLVVFLLLLINVLRIMLDMAYRAFKRGSGAPFRHFRSSAVPSTIFLLPVFGVQNLWYLYDPEMFCKRDLSSNWFAILNATVTSTQGVFVAILFCFFTRDVMEAIRVDYRRRQVVMV